MKRKLTNRLLLLLILLTAWAFRPSAQTVSVTVLYSGAQSFGCCNVCGQDYWCIHNNGGCGTPATCYTKFFADPVPAGNMVTSVSFTVFTAGSGSTITPSINGIVGNTVVDPNNGNWCGNCVQATSTTTSYPCGMPGYVYGGQNALQLCTGTDVCVQKVVVTITYAPNASLSPPTSATVNHNNYCAGAFQTITLTAFGGSGTTLNWHNGSCTGAIIGSGTSLTIPSPNNTITFFASWTSSCGTSTCVSITVVVNPLPIANAGQNQTICAGASATLTATGGGSYQWSGGPANATYIVNPVLTTTYTVTVTSALGCSASDDVTVNVNAFPFADAGPDQAICPGSSATLTAIGGGSYQWSGGPATATYVVSPSSTTTYTVTVTNAGCTSSDDVLVTINPLPNANAGPDQAICTGTSATLTATGGTSYQWSGGPATASYTVFPVITSTYTVTVTNLGCTASDEVIVTVNFLPFANAGPDQTICSGTSATLTASGGGTYQWFGGPATSSYIVSPIATTTYTVSVTSLGCSASDDVIINVNPLPNANVGPDQTICIGASATLSASGGSSYQWLGGPATSSYTVSPLLTTTYTVTVTDLGCTASDNVTVNVNPLPPADAGPNQVICIGASATLTATGGTGYQWSGGPATASYTVNPVSTTTYTVTVNSLGCTASDNVTVTVNALPIANAGTDQTICSGSSATLTASGGSNYQWSGGPATASYVVSPLITTTYTVTVGSLGCTASDDVIVTINSSPISDAGPNQAICIGNSATLTATGGGSYQWLGGPATSSYSVNPVVTTTYTVTVTILGCTASDNVTVTVNQLPLADAGLNQSICIGASATLTASGGGTYQWVGGPPTATYTVSPILNTTYTVTVTSQFGCTASDNVIVTVISLPVANAGSDQTICTGTSATLTASGGNSYQWSGGPATATYTVNPLTTTTYIVTVTISTCTASDDVTITVNPLPVADAGLGQTICLGGSATLTASGGSSYQWSGGPVTAVNIVNPNVTTTYSVTVTDLGCTASDDVIVTVNPLPLANAGQDQSICAGASATLTASGGTSYQWQGGPATSFYLVSPTSTTAYTVTVTDLGCTASDDVIITVNQLNTVSITPNTATICEGSSIVLTAGGASSYIWSPSIALSSTTGATVTASPTTNITYVVTGTLNGCTNSSSVVINVDPLFIVNLGPNTVICPDSTINLNAGNPGASYLWSTAETSQNISITAAGIYWVNVTGGTCNVSDTINISSMPRLNLGSDVSLCNLSEVTLNTDMTAMSYMWSTGQTSSSIIVNQSGEYWLTVYINNCKMTDTINVIGGWESIYLPNAFSPNSDGLNDIFKAVGLGISKFNFKIFDRWGEMIFEANDINIGWDGTYKGNLASTGIYNWIIKYQTVCSGEGYFQKMGHVLLIN